MKFMADIERISRSVKKEWQKFNYDENSFTNIALHHLGNTKLLDQITFEEISKFLLTSSALPEQSEKTFSEAPIRLYRNELFTIDLLIWNSQDTNIHQHSFHGAFKILQGDYVQTTYSYKEIKSFGDDLSYGDLVSLETKILSKGHIQPIRGGVEFIHSTQHVSYPCITLIIRSNFDPSQFPQYTYFISGIRFSTQRHIENKKLIRIASLFKILLKNKTKEAEQTGLSMISLLREEESMLFCFFLFNYLKLSMIATSKNNTLMSSFLDIFSFDSAFQEKLLISLQYERLSSLTSNVKNPEAFRTITSAIERNKTELLNVDAFVSGLEKEEINPAFVTLAKTVLT